MVSDGNSSTFHFKINVNSKTDGPIDPKHYLKIMSFVLSFSDIIKRKIYQFNNNSLLYYFLKKKKRKLEMS